MQNLMDNVIKALKGDKRIFADGKLLKNKLTELALKLDREILACLLSDKKIKQTFFTEAETKKDKLLVFDKDKFIGFVNNKQFLPDSFTSFKNRIGLMSGGEYLKEREEVVLVWPYKDCVLEGGQDKEDQKRDEIFYNEVLAPDEIDRLFEEKVLANFKRIDAKGEHKLDHFTDSDNLIVKGNNLLALHSLKKKFRGKVKLIYIDPPYNIGGDAFGYNDSFNHSTWLTFMKSRLQIAKALLRDDGAIFVQIDHHEIAYLNILMDEVFGVENKVQIITAKVSAASGFKAVNPGPIDVSEFILFYTKNKNSFNFQKNYVEAEYHENYNLFLQRDKNIQNWKLTPLKDIVLKENGYKNEKELKDKYGDSAEIVLKKLISDFAYSHPDEIVSIRDLHKPSDRVKQLQEKSKQDRDTIFPYEKQDGTFSYIINGGALAFYSSKLREIDGAVKVTELLTNFWDHISWAGIAREGGVRLKNGKKPEKLIKQIIEIAGVKHGDIVLDFFMGSGTTCAVAHKLNIQYIGVEQLSYDENDSLKRLQNVVNGDNTGISKSVNWQGGGSFVYLELKEHNESFVSDIKKAETTKALLSIYEKMNKEAFFRYEVDVSQFDSKDFAELPLKEQKQVLLECLDKNHLYVNYSEIDDTTYKASSEDKKLNKEFYGF